MIDHSNWLWGPVAAHSFQLRQSTHNSSVTLPLSGELLVTNHSPSLFLSLSLSLSLSLVDMSDQQPAHFSLDKLPVKLEGANNYTTWCTYVKAALKGQGLYGHVTGTTARPARDAAGTEPDAKSTADWDRRDDKAQSIIMLGVTPAMVNHIAGDMTAREMWDKLASQCRRKDMATRVSLMQQLFTTRLRSADNVDQHIATMSDIRTQFVNIGKPLDDAVAAIALLLSVPAEVPQWEMFLRSHTSSGKDPSWDDVSAAMRAEASLQHQRDSTLTPLGSGALSTVSAYAAKDSKQAAPQRSGRPYCTHCNKRGHVRETCWTLHPDQRKFKQQDEYALAVTVNRVSSSSHVSIPGVGLWHVDSGASGHLSGNRAWFTELLQCEPCTVTVADHGTLTCAQRGTVVLNTRSGRITVRNVLYVPSLGVNLLSVSSIVNAGMRVRFTKSGCSIRTSRNKLIVQAVAHDNLYSVHASPQPSVTAYSVTSGSSEPVSWTTVHGRMGHLSPTALKAMLDKQLALGLTAPAAGSPADIDHCAGCLAGKSHRIPFPAATSHRATQPLALIHSDICGPIQTGADDNSKRYILTFIDDYSRFTWIAITSDKTGTTALNQFIRYKIWAERYTGFSIKTLRTDGGGEYINDQFSTYLSIVGIERQVTTARTPQQNGVAERANRTIMEAARSMLHAAGLPLTFWEYAVMTAVYLRNRSPTKALTDATPYEAWRGDKPDLSHLRVFGCRAYMHLDKTKRNKIQPRSLPVIFVGYAPEAKGWLVYDPVGGHKKTHISRDVTFHESVAGGTLLTTAVSAAAPAVISSTSSSNTTRAAEPVDAGRLSVIDIALDTDTESDEDDSTSSSGAVAPIEQQVASESPVAVQNAAADRPRQRAKPLSGLARQNRELSGFYWQNPTHRDEQVPHSALYAFAVQVGESIGEPRTHKQAVRGPHRVQWEQAMQDELDSIKANDTYTLVPLPAGRQAIGCKWVYKIKRHADGSIDRYKARLVAKGYSQLYGIDFTETFAPVVRFSSLRAILAIAAAADYEIHQISTVITLLASPTPHNLQAHCQ